jgi:hypothetical protein
MKPRTFDPHPSAVLAILGGLVGTLLAMAWLVVAPALGLPQVDVPRALGAVATSEARAGFVVGTVIFFATGTFVIPFVMASMWGWLPGRGDGVGAALVKGPVVGGALWIACAVFALSSGGAGLVWLLLVDVAYGLAVTVIATMGRGIDPIGTLGWGSHRPAQTPISPGART